MKKVLCTLLIICILASFLCVSAFAVDEEEKSGIYAVSVESSYSSAVTVMPLTSDGTTVTGGNKTIEETSQTFYPDAVKLSVTYTTATAGQFMVFVLKAGTVPTKDNIVYINQDAASGTAITFSNVYPSSLSNGETYNIYLSNSSFGYNKIASFKYYEPYKLGDADGNKDVDINDVVAVLKHLANIEILKGTNLKAADATKNGDVDINDVVAILKHLANIELLY